MRGRLRAALGRVRVWTLLPWLLLPLGVAALSGPIGETDAHWHTRLGLDMLAHGRFGGDPAWTYGPARDGWVSTQSGAEILFGLLYTGFGWPGVVAVRVVGFVALVVSVALVCSAAARRSRFDAGLGHARAVGLVTALTCLGLLYVVQERPQIVSLVALPWLGLVALRLAYTGTWPRWWLAGPAVAVWALLHGVAATTAPVLLAAAVLGALVRSRGGLAAGLRAVAVTVVRGLPVLVLVVLAPLAGPPGLSYYSRASAIAAAARDVTKEWSSFPLTDAALYALLGLVVLWAAALAAGPRPVPRTWRIDAAVLTIALMASLALSRYLLVCLLLVVPLVARRVAMARWAQRGWEAVLAPRLAAAVMAVCTAAALLLAMIALPAATGQPPAGPARIWAGIQAGPGPHRVLPFLDLAGQAMTLAGPDVVVGIDGRLDRYGHDALVDYATLLDARPGWEPVWARYPGTTDVVLPSRFGLVGALTARGWRVVCSDGPWVWLVPAGRPATCPR